MVQYKIWYNTVLHGDFEIMFALGFFRDVVWGKRRVGGNKGQL